MSLTNYSKSSFINKELIRYQLIIFFLFLLFSLGLMFFFHKTYLMAIGILIGSIVAQILFYLLEKFIYEASFYDLGKVTKKYHILSSITVSLLLAIAMLIFKDAYLIIGLTIGLLNINFAIILKSFINKKTKKL